MASIERIIINLSDFGRLTSGHTIAYQVAGQRIEIQLSPMSPREMMILILEQLDPPEAVEFLKRRPHNRNHWK